MREVSPCGNSLRAFRDRGLRRERHHACRERAPEANRELVFHLDALFGNEEDFTAALGKQVIDQGQ